MVSMNATECDIQESIKNYKWYHVIQLTDTLSTPGWTEPGTLRTQQAVARALDSLDLANKRVLDIGCRDGLFSFAAEKQGAREVIGIDNDLSPGATELLIPHFKSSVRMHRLNVYDLTPQHFGTFDVVVFAGVLYHLRYPFWALRQVRNVLNSGGWLILETAVMVDDNRHALLHCPVGSESPYEPTSCTFFNTKGLTDTLKSMGFVVRKVDYTMHFQPPASPPSTFMQRLTELFGHRSQAPRGAETVTVDRAVVVCQLGSADPSIANHTVQEYWEGTHDIHTLRPNVFMKPAGSGQLGRDVRL
jgi:SAM-dependent methyltransferase